MRDTDLPQQLRIHDEEGVVGLFGAAETTPPPGGEHGRRHRKQRRGRVITVVALVVVAVLLVAGFVAVRQVVNHLKAKDYSGAGTGSILVQVRDGDGTDTIGKTLDAKDVVASSRAFVNAAHDSGKSDEFQAGFFQMRRHMSAKDAVNRLLDPAARVINKQTIPEGQTALQILPALAKATGVSLASLQAASKQLSQLGIPDDYAPKSVEGFLFPQTYQFDPQMTATEVLQQLVTQYVEVDRELGFDQAAAREHIKPYDALIIASMVEREAKFDADRAKVAQVIYNRLAKKMPLGIDATSLYGAELSGKDPKNVTYREDSPYNTRLKKGLPPTAISNPGEPSMKAAIEPTSGNWLYYVNADAQGHLFFTSSYKAFQKARNTCRAHHWGCD